MRRLILLALLGVLLGMAVVVLYVLGRAGIQSETQRLIADARRSRAVALEAVRDGLAGDLEALLARESKRPWYEYRPLYLPPDLVATNLALVPSKLTERPEDPLVRHYFEFRDGALTNPVFYEGVPDPPPPSEFAGECIPAMAELSPIVKALQAELDGPGHAPARELVDRFVCETNGAPELKLRLMNQPSQETQLKGQWEGYQSRMGKQSGQVSNSRGGDRGRGQQAPAQDQAQQAQQADAGAQQGVDPLAPPAPSSTVPVSTHAFRWLRHGVDARGWPRVLVAARRVDLPGKRWMQGFAIALDHVRDDHVETVAARTGQPLRPEWTSFDQDLVSIEGSLPGGGVASLGGRRPALTCVLPAGSVPRDATSVALAAPLDGLALVDTQAPLEPRGLLAGSRALLDGALALAVAVVLLGGTILGFAARSERRLAQQRSDFVAALTHELKAPLTGFRALTELLHDGLVADEQKKREYYASMLAESERLSRLVQNVLDASKLERGALRVVPEPLSPAPLLEDAASRFRPRLETEGFRFEVAVPPDLPRAIADREALLHVVGNLLDNAAKYGRRGHVGSGQGAEAVIRLEARTVVDHAGTWLEVSVQDRGPGVPAHDRARVFERFYRGDAPRQVGGAGLGLTISRALGRAMGGDVTLDDAPGPGARFSLRLPLAPPLDPPPEVTP